VVVLRYSASLAVAVMLIACGQGTHEPESSGRTATINMAWDVPAPGVRDFLLIGTNRLDQPEAVELDIAGTTVVPARTIRFDVDGLLVAPTAIQDVDAEWLLLASLCDEEHPLDREECRHGPGILISIAASSTVAHVLGEYPELQYSSLDLVGVNAEWIVIRSFRDESLNYWGVRRAEPHRIEPIQVPEFSMSVSNTTGFESRRHTCLSGDGVLWILDTHPTGPTVSGRLTGVDLSASGSKESANVDTLEQQLPNGLLCGDSRLWLITVDPGSQMVTAFGLSHTGELSPAGLPIGPAMAIYYSPDTALVRTEAEAETAGIEPDLTSRLQAFVDGEWSLIDDEFPVSVRPILSGDGKSLLMVGPQPGEVSGRAVR